MQTTLQLFSIFNLMCIHGRHKKDSVEKATNAHEFTVAKHENEFSLFNTASVSVTGVRSESAQQTNAKQQWPIWHKSWSFNNGNFVSLFLGFEVGHRFNKWKS